ncbi:sulfatase family protein [Seonamhaeicola marinus]|uniref:Arylsulfatase n=1 Tax=Seonamhaeicola marinus TaxID=1912246 RepID=A0A5D0J8X8_9FLAO|nr:arylsulfatase [Seonamhaeicola marinus]TYA92194.1 arylsulfatase [Seonamhaeicola marinus]
MKKLLFIGLIALFFSCKEDKQTPEKEITDTIENRRPNIIIFYVDDLGYGDVSSYGATGVKTPNIDKLALNGIRFTDAHSATATCTPSRYAMLTGNYAFRRKAAVLKGDAPLIISPEQPTLPKLLKKVGYKTAVVGKWHLGLGDGNVDWNTTVKPGPAEIGFDYSFLLPSTGDRVPSVYMENGNILNLSEDDPIEVSYTEKVGNRPTGYENPELRRQVADDQHNKTIINGISRIGWMKGGKSAEWVDEDFPYKLTEKANTFIKENKDNRFFLYYSFHDIHVPRLPHKNFQGKSEMGPRGDAIVQVDYVVGEIVKSLETEGISKNTLIIFTSDNGPVLNDGYEDDAVEKLGNHKPAGNLRGGKYSVYEAGTRVPTIVYWPEEVAPKISNALMNQVDFYSSFAALTGQNKEASILDSENHLQALLGKTDKGRVETVLEGYTLALRQGNWKYIKPSNKPGKWITEEKKIESGLTTVEQLYDLGRDPSEQTNVADQFPEKVEELKFKLKQIEELTY